MRSPFKGKSIADRFDEIYDQNYWSSSESKSGFGSEIAFTKPLRNWLAQIIPKLGVKNFVDAGCGDFNWMKVLKLDVKYVGLDIIPRLIDNNNRLYRESSIKFELANICEDKIPTCDLIMVRDCLFHLSYEDINKFFINLARTEYKYLLTTSHIVESNFKNKDISSGYFRLINIFKPPFDFDKNNILDRVYDCPKEYRIAREMILLEKKYVPTKLTERFTNENL